MRSPGPGGFLDLGHTLRSFTMSPVDSVLQQLHRQARTHLAGGGATAPVSDKAKPSRQVGGDFYYRPIWTPRKSIGKFGRS